MARFRETVARQRDLGAVGDDRRWGLGTDALPQEAAGCGSWSAACRGQANFDIRHELSLRTLLTQTTYAHSLSSTTHLRILIIANMQATIPSPQRSRASSGTKSPLSIDLSDLPPLIEPSPPSNTLIITVCSPWKPLGDAANPSKEPPRP
jgi:hypothetical protein